ncbi:hypothetical protein FMUND_5733 [Fusarium mundagurra]|uniref:Uncharacterized protein n=1 Tax=Fusarium mundagurra TaxID=1567541 RepID=A0A8H5YU49_9HYPO|nr:hypothetical protein FMUND_5733 [Fusarium mundagurra]
MANLQDPIIIVDDDDDVPARPPRAPIPQAPPLQSPPRAPPIQGISIIEAIDQTVHGAGRPPGSIIFTEESLTRAELTIFIDLAQMMHDVEKGRDVPYELKHWRHFWEENAFKEWDTSSENTDDLPLRSVTLQENRVRVGKLKVNHPPSVDFPGPPGPARLAGCPIYMNVSPATQDQLLQLIWKDENGKFVNPRYVEMDIPVGTCIDLAVLKFDRTATSRIKEYNIARITNAARRRLMHFAAVGTEMAAYIPADFRAPILEVPELVGDSAEETAPPRRPCPTSVLAAALVDVVRKPPAFTVDVRGGRRLATCALYRWRTNVIFGVMWDTDGHTWWSSVTSSQLVDLEIAWGEGQYIAGCIGATCFSIHDLMDILYEEEEEESVTEWNRLVRRFTRQRMIDQELGIIDDSDSCNSA